MLRSVDYKMLRVVADHPGEDMATLADYYGSLRASVNNAKMLSVLKNHGWITVDRRSIGRGSRYILTPKGEEAVSIIRRLEELE